MMIVVSVITSNIAEKCYLQEWLRNVTHTPFWSPGKCLAAFPASGEHKDIEVLKAILMQIQMSKQNKLDDYIDNPAPVDGQLTERLRESLASRSELCVYDEAMQAESAVHFMCSHKDGVRMLVHFYAFLFFEDWREVRISLPHFFRLIFCISLS